LQVRQQELVQQDREQLFGNAARAAVTAATGGCCLWNNCSGCTETGPKPGQYRRTIVRDVPGTARIFLKKPPT